MGCSGGVPVEDVSGDGFEVLVSRGKGEGCITSVRLGEGDRRAVNCLGNRRVDSGGDVDGVSDQLHVVICDA